MPVHVLDWLTDDIEQAQARHRATVASLYRDPQAGPVYIAGPTCGRRHGLWGNVGAEMLTAPEAWLGEVLADLAQRAEEFGDRRTYRPLYVEVDPFGVHYIDALFGAGVYLYGDQTWSAELVGDPAELTAPDLAHSVVHRQALALVEQAVAATRERVLVAPPVLSCPANIAINLYGQRFLEALLDRPAVAMRVLRLVTDVIAAATRDFHAVIPAHLQCHSVAGSRYAPPGHGQIDGCATQLFSASQYGGFLAPLDEALLGASPGGGMIHLCGEHRQHLAVWRDMAPLRSLQLNDRATDGLPDYLAARRDDQLLYVAPTEGMPAQRVLALTGGRGLVLQCDAPF